MACSKFRWLDGARPDREMTLLGIKLLSFQSHQAVTPQATCRMVGSVESDDGTLQEMTDPCHKTRAEILGANRIGR